MTTVLPTPKPADPVEGQPGHFTHSNWTKAAVEALDRALDAGTFGVPIGTIVAFSGSATLPANWAICNGQNGTPDLQGKFILGASSGRPAGTGGGAEAVTLSVAQIPSHSHGGATNGAGAHQHTYAGGNQTGDQYGLAATAYHQGKVNTDMVDKSTYGNDGSHQHGIPAEGGNQAHENMPPYWALVYIMRVA